MAFKKAETCCLTNLHCTVVYTEGIFTFIIYENTGLLHLLLWDTNRFRFAIDAHSPGILYSKETADNLHWTGCAIRNCCNSGE
jgi:hypothetical protein